MIVDSSVIVAILRGEPEAAGFSKSLQENDSRLSAANYLEAAIVMDGVGDPVVSRRFDDLVREANVKIEPVTERQAHLARAAYRDFGRGSGHPARLNFWDCFAYALAKDLREPLLYKGTDFSKTDVKRA